MTADNNHLSDLSNPNDLMTSSVPQKTRRVVSELDARILGEAYGYTINLNPVYDRAFITTYNSSSRELRIQGDLGTSFEPFRKFDQISVDVKTDRIL